GCEIPFSTRYISSEITHLGTSLHGFLRLKSLDLSRNAVTNLSGISHLKVLEKLNLYYNDIKNLKDLYQLRHNANLHDLDLRLNPVTKNEVDYRLFLIHLLPNLRKLDDRSVRDSERKAAILHFDTDQAYDLMSHVTDQVTLKEGITHSDSITRSEQMKKLARHPSSLDDDDSDLIDLLAKTSGDLNKPYHLSGSEAKDGSFQPHSKEDIRRMDGKTERPTDLHLLQEQGNHRTSDSETPIGDECSSTGSFQSNSSGQPGVSHHASHHEYSTYRKTKGQVHFQDGGDSVLPNGGGYSEEHDAYTSYTSKGHFTPNPKADHETSVKRVPSEAQLEEYKEPPHVQRLFEPPKETKATRPSPVIKDASDELLLSLLHLVDRYWNGSRSLHYHGKFQAQARHIIKTAFLENLASHPSSASKFDEVMKKLEEENLILRGEVEERRKGDGQQFHKELEKGLWETQEEVRLLQGKLQDSMEKNSLLQNQLLKTREPNGVIHPLKAGVDEGLRREVDSLLLENEKLKFQIKHFKQLQELANMLQESHKSLVTTNDHLLKEMDELKKRHLQEVKQLHWSYGELKNSINMIPTSDRNQNLV
ncbi:putative centrosomal protein, partial [Apostichopus japonicus]